MTSLEEAFINIGMDESKFMKKVSKASEINHVQDKVKNKSQSHSESE